MLKIRKPLRRVFGFTFLFTIYFIFASQIQSFQKVYSLPHDKSRELPSPNSCSIKDERGDMGPIFHAWCWKFVDITNSINEISDAGFRSIQVSPVQKEKPVNEDIEGRGKKLATWWSLYQPLNFKIGNCLGSKEDFEKMCRVAHRVGLKIIVDVVANHLAQGNRGKGYFAGIDEDEELLKLNLGNNLFHETGFEHNNYFNRFDITQKSLNGVPGLNTGNEELQKIIIKFLEELIDCGADGFRFDAAKHIELPEDVDGDFGSKFWPNVIGAIVKKKSDIYVYGETLQDGYTDFNNYLEYMNITDNKIGISIAEGLRNRDVWKVSILHSPGGWDPGNFVTWVESHDTFAETEDPNKSTADLSSEDIKLGWAMNASRKGAVPLFFARPGDYHDYNLSRKADIKGRMGENLSFSTLWKDKGIAEINKFRRVAADQEDYVDRCGKYVWGTFRENVGVVIVNLSDSEENVNLAIDPQKSKIKLKEGSYTDIISNYRRFEVQGDCLKGSIERRSICVVYFCSVPDVFIEPPKSWFYFDDFSIRLGSNTNEAYYSKNREEEKSFKNGDSIEISANDNDLNTEEENKKDGVVVNLKTKSSNNEHVFAEITKSYIFRKCLNKIQVEFHSMNGQGRIYGYDENKSIKLDDSAWPGIAMKPKDNTNKIWTYEIEIEKEKLILNEISLYWNFIVSNSKCQIPKKFEPGIRVCVGQKLIIFEEEEAYRIEIIEC